MTSLTTTQIDVWAVAAILNITYDAAETRLRKTKAEAAKMLAAATAAGRMKDGKAIKEAVLKPAKARPRGIKKEDGNDAALHGMSMSAHHYTLC